MGGRWQVFRRRRGVTRRTDGRLRDALGEDRQLVAAGSAALEELGGAVVQTGRQAVGTESWRRRARGGLRVRKNWRKDQVENKQKERGRIQSSWEGKADKKNTINSYNVTNDCPIV